MQERIRRLMNSPSWAFWQVVVALVGLAVTYSVFFLQKQDKRIQISFSVSSVVQINKDLQPEIDMKLRGISFSDIAFVEYKLENVGNTPILESDFVEPITFSFSPDWDIVGVNLDNREYGSGTYKIQFEPEGESPDLLQLHKLKITPVLLNPAEGWRGKFVVITRKVGSPINFDVNSHIIGVSKLEKVDITNVTLSQEKYDLKQIVFGIVLGILVSMLTLNASKFLKAIRKSPTRIGTK